MKNNFKFHCILLIIAVVIGFAIDSSTVWADYCQGFLDGWNEQGDSREMPVTEVASGKSSLLLFSIGLLACAYTIVVFWISFVKLLLQLRAGDVFNKDIAFRTRYMGNMLIAFFLGLFLIYQSHATSMELSGSPLVIGCGLLIISEIFRIARVMKEEQDLTI